MSNDTQSTDTAVYQRYAAAAHQREAALCCPVQYRTEYLNVIPDEILERDYGCGDPSSYVREGETVLDLGSGGGKICYILSQVVGPAGRVIGVDCNQEMLALARQHRGAVAAEIGHDNVEFHCGRIQDLGLDLDRLSETLAGHQINTPDDWLHVRQVEDRLRREEPMIPDASVDCVVSNCVLNLVRQDDRQQLFAEIYRVLEQHGRVAISDIVADEDVPEPLRRDPELWSGCLSGAFREDRFLAAFEAAGFHGIRIVKRDEQPWRTVEGIEFRSVTVEAFKGRKGPCLERNQAVIYRGPFRRVEDDEGHAYDRGERMAVCDKTFRLLGQDPYVGKFDLIEPRVAVPVEAAEPFACRGARRRSARETKGHEYHETTDSPDTRCDQDGPCC